MQAPVNSSCSEPFPLLKSFTRVASQPKETWLSRHVKWLKAEREGAQKIAVFTLAFFEISSLACSLVGIIPLRWAFKESRRLDDQASFFAQAELADRPAEGAIEMKEDTRTFNHMHDFAISNGIIWCRLRHVGDEWKPIYFDGYPEGLVPCSIRSDGANLVVLDQHQYVHYKKVLREFRSEEISAANGHKIQLGRVNVEQDRYIAIDKSERDNWKDKWFSLPYAHIYLLVNLVTGKRLRIPLDAKAWAISHRGVYNNYLEDRLGHRHFVDGGTTTLYVLDSKGREIVEHDPWSPQFAHMSIPLPETANQTFEAENMSASASTLMVIGYERRKEEETEVLRIQTRLADLDSIGWNPLFSYTYFDCSISAKTWVMPLRAWQTHPLELEENSFVTEHITILQTGEGNQARELRVKGVKGGEVGYYYKHIAEPSWSFKATEGERVTIEEALPLTRQAKTPFQTSVKDYSAKTIYLSYPGNLPTLSTLSARLLTFGHRSLHSKLELTLDEKSYELDVYKKKTWKNFCGLQGSSYELVIPEPLHRDWRLLACFQGKMVIPLEVSERAGSSLIFQSQPASIFKFTWEPIDEC